MDFMIGKDFLVCFWEDRFAMSKQNSEEPLFLHPLPRQCFNHLIHLAEGNAPVKKGPFLGEQ